MGGPGWPPAAPHKGQDRKGAGYHEATAPPTRFGSIQAAG